MDVELVGPDGLQDALRDWERLHDADPDLTPFNSAAWGRTWLEHWDPDAEPWLMRVLLGDRVVGIAPFALQRRRGVRVLSMIGKEPGDYWDIIAAPPDRPAVVQAIAAELRRRSRAWDIAVVSCLPPGSNTVSGLSAGGVRLFRRPPIRSPAIRLPSSFEEYLRALPSRRRGNLRRHLNRLDRGEVSLREVVQPAQIPDLMSRWRELRSRQWRHTGRQLSPSHSEDRFHRFMVQAAVALLKPGYTSLWEVYAGERLAGIYLNFCDRRSFYWYLGGYEPDLAGLGVGKIVVAATIRASIEAKRERYDFTRGDDEYKYWYGAEDRLLDSVVLGHTGPNSQAVFMAARALARYRDRNL